MNYNFNMSKIYMNKLEKKIKDLESRIDKATEYIEDRFTINEETGEYYMTHTFDRDNVKELLDILKGNNE